MSRVLAVAANTFRETVRERVLYNLAFFALLMTASGLVLGQLSIRQDEKILKDVGLAAMDLFGTAIAVLIGTGLVAKEIERRSLYPLLAKPLSRSEFYLGKFAGLAFTLLVNLSVMTAGLYATLLATGRRVDALLLSAVYPMFLGLVLVVAFAMLFSTVGSSSMIAAVFTVGVVVAGRFADVVRHARQVVPDLPQWLVDALYALLPNYAQLRLQGPRGVRGPGARGGARLGDRVRRRLPGRGARPRPRLLREPRLPVKRARPLLLLLLAPLVPLSQGRIEQRLGAYRAQEEVLYFWSGEHVRRLFPGYESLAADVYWLRTVQYYGGERRFAGDKRYELLRPLVEITTTLDPRLEIAYRYGAIFLSEAPPGGAGRPREGIEVMEKGVRNLPRSWRLRQELGFFHFLYLHDSARASEILMEAAAIPGSAFWLRTLAADLLARGGDREASRRMWRQLYEREDEGVLKQNARVRLRHLDALDAADALTARVAEYARRHGRRPARLEELRAAGLWSGSLGDPEGVPFSYDESTGTVTLSTRSPLWRPE